MNALVIDDHPVVLRGCCDLLTRAAINPIFLASNLADGVQLFRKHKPHIVILDLAFRADPLGGLGFLKWLRQQEAATRVIVLTMHTDAGIARRVIQTGADALVAKHEAADGLIEALVKVRAGNVYLSPTMAVKLAFQPAGADGFEHLTLRELETLKLLGQGERYDAIADRMHVSYKTVVNTVANLKRKLDAKTLGQLTRIAVTSSIKVHEMNY